MDPSSFAFCILLPEKSCSAVEPCGIYGIWKQAPKAPQSQLQWFDLDLFFVLLEPPLYPSRQLPIRPGCPGARHDLLRCWGPLGGALASRWPSPFLVCNIEKKCQMFDRFPEFPDVSCKKTNKSSQRHQWGS